MLSEQERIALKEQARELLQDDQTQVVYRQPLLAMLIMRLQLVVVIDDRLKTAATDGSRIFVDARFISELSADDRIFVLAHEVWHCALGHFARQPYLNKMSSTATREAKLWNIACDFEVNHIVDDILNYHPKFALFDMHLNGYSAEQIYEMLAKRKKANFREPFDQHLTAKPIPQNESGKQEIDPDYQPGTYTEQSAERWRHYVTQAAQTIKNQQGELPSSVAIVLEKLLRPTLSWVDILKPYVEQTIGYRYNWQRPNRRHLHQGLYLPGNRDEKLDIVVAVDTSGSTHGHLASFFSELYGILSSFSRVNVHLIECDSAVQQHQVFTEQELTKLPLWRPKGLGGTCFTPVFNYIADVNQHIPSPNLLVFFTDGYGSAPAQPPQFPVLWVLTPNGKKPTAWGQSAHLNGRVYA